MGIRLMIVLGTIVSVAPWIGATEIGDAPVGYKLVWSDEFDNTELNRDNWRFDKGFLWNEEEQYYTENNYFIKDGILTIEARVEEQDNPDYDPQSKDFRYNNPKVRYTSTRINTQRKQEFKYGRFECRARIPVASGAWPAFWTLGSEMGWPNSGEIDIMEYYPKHGVPSLHANVGWGGEKSDWDQVWRSYYRALQHFIDEDPDWLDNYHTYRMDWDRDYIRLYVDDYLMRETPLDMTFNGSHGGRKNPMRQPHYIILNLAIAGLGGKPDESKFPLRFEIDYVRVYQQE